MAYVEKIFGAPGTGKTFTLVERLQGYLNKNCPFDQTLTLSFTKVAARHIKRKIQERNNNKFNDKEMHHSVRTIDSYLMNKIREDKDKIAEITISKEFNNLNLYIYSSFRITKKESNIDFYSYDKNLYSLGIIKNFSF